MPWTSLIWITLLFSIICGNRLMDNRLRRPNYAGLKADTDSQALELSAAFSSKSFLRALRDSAASANVAEDEARAFQEDNDHLDVNDMQSDNKIDFKSLNGLNAETKRDFIIMNTRDMRSESTDGLSEIFPMDGIGAQLPAKSDDFEAVDAGGASTQLLTAASNYADTYEDLLADANKEDVKRGGAALSIGCDCKLKNDLIDLGQQHFPRYLLNAVCQTEQSPNEYPQKCWRGSICRPLEYKVKVLTFRTLVDHGQKDPAIAWLPDDLRQLWKFKTVTVAAGCFCSY